MKYLEVAWSAFALARCFFLPLLCLFTSGTMTALVCFGLRDFPGYWMFRVKIGKMVDMVVQTCVLNAWEPEAREL